MMNNRYSIRKESIELVLYLFNIIPDPLNISINKVQ